MAFDWWDFFAFAEELAKSPGSEASARTAISRYYYACHNIAKPRFSLQHTELWNAYKDHADPECRKIGIHGDRLRGARVWADYVSRSRATSTELTSTRLAAATLRKLLEELSKK